MWLAAKAVVVVWVVCAVCCVRADEHNNVYEDAEVVIVWTNSVGPYHHPSETYAYRTLPYCQGSDLVDHRHETLGESLLGYELVNSGIGVRFREKVEDHEICRMSLSEEDAEKFEYAVMNSYWYDHHADNLPMWGMVGMVAVDEEDGSEAAYLFTHRKFSFGYNGNQIIEVNLTTENPELIVAGADVVLTYSVEWVATETAFEDRYDRYLDHGFFSHSIRTFSLVNSIMMVIFLVGLVFMILMRTLKRDFARYSKDAEDDLPLGDDSGWKLLYGDVFRPPPSLAFLSACLGSGAQLAVLAIALMVASSVQAMYKKRGALLTLAIFVYAVTNIVAGYVSGSFYKAMGGSAWKRTMMLTAGLFPGLVFAATLVLNGIAVSYNSLSAQPFSAVLAVVLVWAFIAFPLTLVGTLFGRSLGGEDGAPFKPKRVPRHIPERVWYLQPMVLIWLGGILPFAACFLELYFLLATFSSQLFYSVAGYLLVVFLVLLVVVASCSIVATYLTLAAEDWRWQWLAFLSSASTGGFVFLYSAYYFVARTRMEGLLQSSVFFFYAAIAALGLSAITGTVGFFAARRFVYTLYAEIKLE